MRDVLTDEHVPPKAVGGQPLLLTCANCNHTAGSRLDAHAERREAISDLLAGRESGRSLRGRFAIGDAIIQGNTWLSGGAYNWRA